MFRLLEVTGKDSQDFLAKMLASKVIGVQSKEASKGLLLDGSSKILGQFDLVCETKERYFLLTFVERVSSLKEELDKVLFTEEVELISRNEDYTFIKNQSAQNCEERLVEFKEGIPSRWRSWIYGYDFCQSNESTDYEYARISSLVPWPDYEWKMRETFALDAGFYSWVDRNKGCYPGQEVVEKSLNLGHPGKSLFLVEGSSGVPEFLEQKELEICSMAEHKEKIRALVRCRWKDKDLPLKGEWIKLKDSIPMEG